MEYSKHWPLVVRNIDGVLNSYADLLSRAAYQLHVLRMQRSTHDVLALPVRVHSYKTETPSKTQSRLVTLNIIATETVTVIAAYKADTTVFKKVRMLDIYNILTGLRLGLERDSQCLMKYYTHPPHTSGSSNLTSNRMKRS